MILLLLLWIQGLLGTSLITSTTWLWGDGDGVYLSLYEGNDSFIRLMKQNDEITIGLVKRGPNWLGKSFCGEVLPAAMHRFIEMHKINIQEISLLRVFNVAVPAVAGCKCYARLMLSMGFDVVNYSSVSNERELLHFCNDSYNHDTVWEAYPSIPEKVRLPNVSESQMKVIDTASIVNTFYTDKISSVEDVD